jgi:hypothetical protein
VLNALLTGIGCATRNYKLLLLLWVFNLLFTLPLIIPVFVLIQQSTTGRGAAQRMSGDQLDVIWLIDLVNGQFEGLSPASLGLTTLFLLLFCGGLYLLANLFFAGGILEVLNRPKFTMRRFWRGGGTFFARFVRLWIYSLFFYSAVLIGHQLVQQAINRTARQASAEGPVQVKKIVLLVITLLLLALVNLAFDYARISTVWRDGRKMWREAVNGWRFALAYVGRAYSLYLLLALIGLAIFAFFCWLRGSVRQDSFFAVVVAFVFGQFAVLARVWMRVALYGGQMQFYYQLAQPPPDVKRAPSFEFMPATGELPPLAAIVPASSALASAVEPVPEKVEERHES